MLEAPRLERHLASRRGALILGTDDFFGTPHYTVSVETGDGGQRTIGLGPSIAEALAQAERWFASRDDAVLVQCLGLEATHAD